MKNLKNLATIGQRLRSIVGLLHASLREIFDESAYARFLQRNACASSRDSYAAFRRETEAAKARRPRCC